MASPVWFFALAMGWTAVLLGLHRSLAAPSQKRLETSVAALCYALAAAALALFAASTLAGLPAPAVKNTLRAGLAWAAPFAVGAAFAAAFSPRESAAGIRFRKTMASATAWYVGLAFIQFEIGKLLHDSEMREFFRASGLPLALMYAVMAVETCAAAFLLMGRGRIWAAAILAAVMVAAIGTHVSNGDPASDSLDAMRMLALCVALAGMLFSPSQERPAPQSEAPTRAARQP
ncbi:DoxX family protein [Massilia endophytica]|uniref:DoxX family protein n=1 Tax=Massilia endophytica TaxID=2899220 RepID=UPI001E415DA9|nr:DoxX family protein [Massilia endophytica]UGQ46923.1 DoxX family protein [Massilia endophytica]